MSCESSDISQFCKQELFEWDMFQHETAPFPDDVLKLGHYLELSINISSAMTAKILTKNGQVLHRSNYKPFTPDELLDKDRSNAQDHFMARVHKRLGSILLPRELKDIGLENTQQYHLYKDQIQNEPTFSQVAENLEPMSDMGDHYIGEEILLSRM